MLPAIFALASLCLSSGAGYQNQSESHAVWSAYLNIVNTREASFTFVIQDHTRTMFLPWLGAFVWPFAISEARLRSRLPALRVDTLASYSLSNVHPQSVNAGLRTSSPYRLSSSEVSLGFVFSAVGFSANRDQALFHVDYMCGLCGYGEYVLMRKTADQWIIEARAGTWIS